MLRGGMKRKYAAFTLMEALVFLFLFSLITLVFFQTFALGTKLIQQSKNRLAAIELGNQKMEIIRSLDYNNIGTTTGIPSGSLLQDETFQQSNGLFNMHTFIEYVDDTYDGKIGGTPNDANPADYKRVRLDVTWGGASDAETVTFFSTFAPPGVEQSVGGGVLSINILNAQGTGVSGADVTIVNNTVTPNINVTTQTDSTGNLFLIGYPASTQKYQITFSNTGYFGSHTYAPYPTTSFVPTDIHASVVNNTVNQASFIMDLASTLNLKTVDPFDQPVANIAYSLAGGRRIGTVAGSNPPQPVYDFSDTTSTTDGNGNKTYADRSYGPYIWTATSLAGAGRTFVRLSPESTTSANNIDVVAGTTPTIKMILADNAIASVLVTVLQSSTGAPLAGASVHLSNSSLGYDATVTSSQFGKAYFPTALPALTPGTYDLSVSLTGFTTVNTTVVVGSGIVTKNVSL